MGRDKYGVARATGLVLRVCVRVSVCMCVILNLCKYGVYAVVGDKKKNNVTICTFFLN